MVFDALMPWWLIAVLVIGAVGVTFRAYWRPLVPLSIGFQSVLVSLRLTVLFLLIFILQRPVLLEPSTGRFDAIVPILVDVSRSMRLNDANDDGHRRIDEASRLVEQVLLPSVGEVFDVDVLGFGELLAPVEPMNLRADARQSDLQGALRGVRERYRGRTVAGVIVVSDGGGTGSESAMVSGAGAFPVFAVGIGRAVIERDREVLNVTVGPANLANSVVDLNASVVSHGFGKEPIEVRLLEDGRLVQLDWVTPAESGAPLPIVFRVSPKSDVATRYTVELPVDPSELTPDNNTRRVLVPPSGRLRRVLLVEGAPGYDHSFLKRAWLQDEGIELDSVVLKGANDRGQNTFYIQGDTDRTHALSTGYPQHRPALFFYDAVVLANTPGDFFSPDQLNMTVDFVSKRGGGLLVFGAQAFAGRGLASTPIETILPLHLAGRTTTIAQGAVREPNTVSLTADGANHGLMRLGMTPDINQARWDAVPPLAGVAALGDPKPGASVLAHTVGAGGGLYPLIAVQRYGRGRTMVFTGEASWRWKMLLPSDDDTYDTFWKQTVRWLSEIAPGQVTVSTEGGGVPGEVVHLEISSRDSTYETVADASITAHVTGPAGDIQEIRPSLIDAVSGRYTAKFTPTQSGVYYIDVRADQGSLSLGNVETWILVGGSDRELTDPRMNSEALARLAQRTGGAVVPADALGELPGQIRERATVPATLIRLDLWNNVWVFLLLVFLPSAEWLLRRQWGMR